ncbi:LysM peptidoglycan-binding domain-containing protein [Verticiella sediminum]|uniref:LysM peptidoglycan-binding domain-containing protein n=1 Tax=Verticiella sediminum TaxID=1247510 RepID=A0A556ABX9_9BURK|nr:transglycosylase SLT domain-containing protein [Verticiella sediminum]TSH90380.1 LysM peptidoglycan-binding domain-containing protein [Verticiella sediminum]
MRAWLAAGAAVMLAACGTVQQSAGPVSASPSLAGLAPQPSFPTVDVAAPPADVWKRLRRGFAMPDLQTREVALWTDVYASRPDMIRRMMERSSPYLYFILEEINRRGLPTELALLPFVESGWDPTALSRSKASGLWQFIPSTGRHFKLRQDDWVDERRDLVASTQAALDYLEYLFNFQGDWYLALASYNWGEGAVMRAMQKNEAAGLPTDYTSLAMPDETRNYVPKLQAIKNIVAEPARYGVTLPNVANQPYFVRVARAGDIDVPLAARLAGMSVEEFTALNPAFNRGVISRETGKPILLPVGQVDVFLANLDAYDGPLVTPQTRPAPAAVAKAQAQGQAARAAAGSQAGKARAAARTRTHRVRSGDTLYKLAERYSTTVQALQSLNRLSHSRLRVGQLIRVPGAG